MKIFNNISRRTFIVMSSANIATVGLTNVALAKVYTDNDLAMGGYDPVAYFTQGAPVEGSADHTVMWSDAEWRFSSATNLEIFNQDPEKYAPQYGGHCAYAAAKGSLASSNPQAWTIHDGKLYLNYSRPIRAIWGRDIPGNISKADANWPSLM